MTVRPAKIQISLGIRPVWSESSLSAWRKLGSLATYWVHSEDWSDWADAQADMSLRGRTCHFFGFVMRQLIFDNHSIIKSRENLSLGIYDQVGLKSACSATDTSKGLLKFCCGQQRLRSDWAIAQADLSSLGAQSFCWFCREVAHIVMRLKDADYRMANSA